MSNLFKSDLSKLFSSRVAIQISTILQSFIIARALGPENKGFYTEITIYPTIIGALSMLGLYTGIVKLSAKKNLSDRYNISKTILKSTFILGLTGSLVAAFINGVYFSTQKAFYDCAVFYGIYVLIYVMNRGLSAYNNGQGNFGLFSISSVILYPSYFFLILVLFICDSISVATTLYSLLVANTISLVFLIYKNTELKQIKQNFSSKFLIKYSLRFSVADLAEPVYLYYDKAILALFLSPYFFGIYTISASTAGLITIFSNTFSIKLFSDVANKKKNNIAQYIKINISIMALSAIVLSVLIPCLIPLFYGDAYRESIIPAIILLITCIIQGQSFVLERAILADGHPYTGITAKIIGMLTFGLLLLAFFTFDLNNIVIAAICSVFTSIIYFVYIQRKAKVLFKLNESLFPDAKFLKFLFGSITKFIFR